LAAGETASTLTIVCLHIANTSNGIWSFEGALWQMNVLPRQVKLPAFFGPLQALRPTTGQSVFSRLLALPETAGTVQGFHMQHQEESQWCWTAVATSVARKYDPNSALMQCDVACALYKSQNTPLACCGIDRPTCNQPQALSDVLRITGNLSGNAIDREGVPIDHIADFDFLAAQIGQDRPVCIRIGWPPDCTLGHFIVITGFRKTDTGELMVDVQDPEDDAVDDPKAITIAELTTNYALVGGKWTWTYRTQAAAGRMT
jgi:hypothetical protein